MERLTKSEEEIMHILWKIAPCTVSQVLDYIEQEQGEERPPHSTISTLVRSIEEKKFLTHKAYGKTYEYHIAIPKSKYTSLNVKQVLQDYFENSPAEMLSFLIQEKHINKKEMKEIQELIKNSKS
jgi:BlaI family penicillinase repressor